MRININAIYTNDSKGNRIELISPTTLCNRLHDALDRNNQGCQVLLSGYLQTHGQAKSPEQMGYLHAVIVPSALKGFQDAGYYSFTEFDAYEALKAMFFSETKVNEKTGEIMNITRSLADADMPELAKFISDCILFIEEHFGILVEPPKYK